jgi:antibiotic biosynthesis monooxygenase (ABM) superfamily enzyme
MNTVRSENGTPGDPVSTQVTRFVPAAKAARFEGLLRDLMAVARRFEGHLGVDVLRPDGGGDYRIIFRYRGRAEHAAWMDSAERARLVARIDELLEDPGGGEVRSVDGWEGWFVAPGYAPPAPPRRWKMAAITLAALYPIVLGLVTALRPLTEDWPLALGLLATIAISVTLMNWIVMPALTRRLGAWLRR